MKTSLKFYFFALASQLFFVSCYDLVKTKPGGGILPHGGDAGSGGGSGSAAVVTSCGETASQTQTTYLAGNVVLPTNCISNIASTSLFASGDRSYLLAKLNPKTSATNFAANGVLSTLTPKSASTHYLFEFGASKTISQLWLNLPSNLTSETDIPKVEVNYTDELAYIFGSELNGSAENLFVSKLDLSKPLNQNSLTANPLFLDTASIGNNSTTQVQLLSYCPMAGCQYITIGSYNNSSPNITNAFTMNEIDLVNKTKLNTQALPQGKWFSSLGQEFNNFNQLVTIASPDSTTPSKINIYFYDITSLSTPPTSFSFDLAADSMKNLPGGGSALFDTNLVNFFKVKSIDNSDGDVYIYGTVPIKTSLSTAVSGIPTASSAKASIGFIAKLVSPKVAPPTAPALTGVVFIYDKNVPIDTQHVVLNDMGVYDDKYLFVLGNFKTAASPQLLAGSTPNSFQGLESSFIGIFDGTEFTSTEPATAVIPAGATDSNGKTTKALFIDLPNSIINSHSLLFKDGKNNIKVSGSVQVPSATDKNPVQTFPATAPLTSTNPALFFNQIDFIFPPGST